MLTRTSVRPFWKHRSLEVSTHCRLHSMACSCSQLQTRVSFTECVQAISQRCSCARITPKQFSIPISCQVFQISFLLAPRMEPSVSGTQTTIQWQLGAQCLLQLEFSLFARYSQMKWLLQGGVTEGSDHSRSRVVLLSGQLTMHTRMELQLSASASIKSSFALEASKVRCASGKLDPVSLSHISRSIQARSQKCKSSPMTHTWWLQRETAQSSVGTLSRRNALPTRLNAWVELTALPLHPKTATGSCQLDKNVRSHIGTSGNLSQSSFLRVAPSRVSQMSSCLSQSQAIIAISQLEVLSVSSESMILQLVPSLPSAELIPAAWPVWNSLQMINN